MSLSSTLSAPLFTGTAGTTSDVPGKWHIALGGRGFMVDLASGDFRRHSIPLLRQQADQSAQPGESSINPDDLWRRTMASWHKGAGQRNYDGEGSDPARFWQSKGLNPWVEGELCLHHDTVEILDSAETNLRLAVAGTRLYATVGAAIRYTTDLSAWSDITGESATPATGITTDGYSVYSSHGADGIYVTNSGATSTAKGVTGDVDGVRWVKGRLFAWDDNKLYNVTEYDTGTPDALPTALLTHANADFDWVDVAEANGFYFPAGVSGSKSLIYKTAVKPDGTGLDTPTVAAELTDGEVVYSIQGYVGFLLIGTNQGVRFGVPNDAGDITLGDVIETDTIVRCFEPEGFFAWFGWSNYDGTSTGLGRMDLGVFNGTRPAYASDLMATAQGAVLSCATFDDRRVFTVSGAGIYTEDRDTFVATGSLESGRISYGLYDPKISQYVTVNHSALTDATASVAMDLAWDGGDYSTIGGVNSQPGAIRSNFSTNRRRAEHFELRLTVTPDTDADPMLSPIIGRITLRSDPTASRSERVYVPLIIAAEVKDQGGSLVGRDVLDDLAFLSELEDSGDSVIYQEAGIGFPVTLVDHEWRPMFLPQGQTGFHGTYVVHLKRFATE